MELNTKLIIEINYLKKFNINIIIILYMLNSFISYTSKLITH